jgi:hypothetical protein
MSWTQNNPTARRALAGAAAIGLAASAVAAHAAIIVVRSNGPSASAFPPGKSLPSSTAIVLKAGDVITVLDATGTRVLRGPGKIPVSGTGQANVNGIAALIADTGARQSRTGATRGANVVAPHPGNLWYVDVTRGGNFCVGNVKALALWRANSDLAASVSVMAMGSSGAHVPVEITFRPGQAVASWPLAALPVTEGSRFRLAGATPVTIVTRLLPSTPISLDDAATALLDHGCTAQVDTLVAATVADPGS